MGEMLAADPDVHKGGRSEAISQRVTLPKLGISAKQSSRAQQLAKLPELEFERRVAKPQNRLLRAARDAATEQAREQADATPIRTVDVRIEHCSISDLVVQPESVDLVFTDPPYPTEFIPLWSDLGVFAAKALKPGGLLVAYSGQMFLPEAMSRLAEHLDYWWCYAITHVGAFFQLRIRHTQVGWKPLLVYRKPGTGLPPWTNDIVTDGVREKSGHDWQQSESEAGYWVDKLTAPGELVVDPFLGSGATAAVCKTLGRRFIGCDTDPLAVARTKERVA
jgi:16S rRNA G966 N2-methylase RsmD